MTARENIPMPIASQAIAQILRAISPPTTLVHVGWGNGLGDLTQWTAWQVPQAFVIEAEESKLAACQAQALALAQAEGQPSPAWQTIHATLSAQSGEQTYHLASNPSESGLLPTASLQHAWPHLQTVATQTVVTCSLDEIWQNISSQLPMSKSALSTWFIIDCLASTDILAGGLTTLQAAQVVCARSLLANRAVLCDQMRAAGWVEAGWAESQHPAFGRAWFTRDTASELEIAAKRLSQLMAECDALAQSCAAATQAKELALQERDAMGKAKQAETAAKNSAINERDALAKEKQTEAAKNRERQHLQHEELVKAEAQIELIKDLLLREQGI